MTDKQAEASETPETDAFAQRPSNISLEYGSPEAIAVTKLLFEWYSLARDLERRLRAAESRITVLEQERKMLLATMAAERMK